MNPRIPFVLLVTSLPLLLLLSSAFLVMDTWFYHLTAGANPSADNVLGYVRGSARLNVSMTPAEKSHLADVRSLIYSIRMLLSVASLVALASFGVLAQSRAWLAKAVIVGSALSTGICVLFVLLEAFFQQTFEVFHLIFFAPRSYLFPFDSTLIRLFPESYFLRAFAAIIVTCASFSFLLLSAALFCRRKK